MIVSIANNKGGVSKTTTAITLASILKEKGYSVLLVDTDPQGSATDQLRVNPQGIATLYDIIFDGEKTDNVIIETDYCDFIPSDPLLREADSKLSGVDRNFKLKEALLPVVEKYDFILIDTPPMQGIMLYNALTISETVIVPTTADRIAFAGLSQLFDIVRTVKKYTNTDLRLSGLLIVQLEARTKLARHLLQDQIPKIAEMLDVDVFSATIRKAVAVKESQTERIPLIKYAKNDNVTLDYIALAEEFLQKELNK